MGVVYDTVWQVRKFLEMAGEEHPEDVEPAKDLAEELEGLVINKPYGTVMMGLGEMLAHVMENYLDDAAEEIRENLEKKMRQRFRGPNGRKNKAGSVLDTRARQER